MAKPPGLDVRRKGSVLSILIEVTRLSYVGRTEPMGRLHFQKEPQSEGSRF